MQCAQDYDTGLAPSWVLEIQVPSGTEIKQDNGSNGVTYLLVDQQWNVDDNGQEQFYHYAEKAFNTSGVETISRIAIDFDPAYEHLTLHSIVVHRDGQAASRTNRARMDVIQREKELENLIYDGSKTLNIFLEDIRVGDTVEYSFSIRGANPAFSGHFTKQLKLRWAVPVECVSYRIIWPSTRPLHIKTYLSELAPVTTVSGDQTEYIWRKEHLEALVTDTNTPNWFSPFPTLFLSDFSNWREVVAWAVPLYAPTPMTSLRQKVLDTIETTAHTDEERILSALRFVQDDIRYLGFEFGTGSHRPNDPETVIRQRFGDCKDKSRLLVSLLRAMGIEAAPALVNSYNGKTINEGLPSPEAFNHVIVRLHYNNRTYWLDPTLTYQRGDLDSRFSPDYEYALVIADGSSELERFADTVTAYNTKEVEERFDLPADEKGEAGYRIITHLERFYADSMRQQLATTSLSELQQSYLNYTATYYPEVRIAKDAQISDSSAENRLSLTESYAVPKIWTMSKDGRYILADFEPSLIHDNIRNVTSPKRTMPYALAHPVRYRQATRIVIGRDSNFENEHVVVKDKAFNFVRNVDYRGDTLEIEYLYESLKDHVLPEEIATYSANIQNVLDIAGYQIQKPNPAFHFGEYHFDLHDVNWPLAAAVLLSFSASVFVFWRYGYRYDPPFMLLDDTDTTLQGIRGWLILPGLSLLITPVRILLGAKSLLYTFSAEQWSILADRVGTAMLITISLEVICNVLMVTASLFLIPLFFQRRYTFPRFFILFLTAALLFSSLDLLLLHLFASSWVGPSEQMMRSLLKQALFAGVWISYFKKSRRVQATFVQRRMAQKVYLEEPQSSAISVADSTG